MTVTKRSTVEHNHPGMGWLAPFALALLLPALAHSATIVPPTKVIYRPNLVVRNLRFDFVNHYLRFDVSNAGTAATTVQALGEASFNDPAGSRVGFCIPPLAVGASHAYAIRLPSGSATDPCAFVQADNTFLIVESNENDNIGRLCIVG